MRKITQSITASLIPNTISSDEIIKTNVYNSGGTNCDQELLRSHQNSTEDIAREISETSVDYIKTMQKPDPPTIISTSSPTVISTSNLPAIPSSPTSTFASAPNSPYQSSSQTSDHELGHMDRIRKNGVDTGKAGDLSDMGGWKKAKSCEVDTGEAGDTSKEVNKSCNDSRLVKIPARRLLDKFKAHLKSNFKRKFRNHYGNGDMIKL